MLSKGGVKRKILPIVGFAPSQSPHHPEIQDRKFRWAHPMQHSGRRTCSYALQLRHFPDWLYFALRHEGSAPCWRRGGLYPLASVPRGRSSPRRAWRHHLRPIRPLFRPLMAFWDIEGLGACRRNAGTKAAPGVGRLALDITKNGSVVSCILVGMTGRTVQGRVLEPLISDEQRALIPEVSGNSINGLGEPARRRPSPVYWHPPSRTARTCPSFIHRSATIFPSSTALRTYYVTAQIEASAILREPLASEPLFGSALGLVTENS